MVTQNKFACLENESESKTCVTENAREEKKVIVIGDSNIKRVEIPILKSLKPENKKHLFVTKRSGAKVAECERRLVTALKEECKARNVKVIVHVGTNDVQRTGSEVLLGKIRNLIRAAKDSRSGVDMTICSIPSRVDKGGFVFSRSESVNSRLTTICKEEGATHLDLSHELRKCRFPLGRDGVHYSWKGAQVVGTLIGEVANNFLRK